MRNVGSPPRYGHAAAYSKSDTVAIPGEADALYVGGGGDVAVVLANGGTAIVFKAVPTGTTLQVHMYRVNSTGTTATDLVILREHP